MKLSRLSVATLPVVTRDLISCKAVTNLLIITIEIDMSNGRMWSAFDEAQEFRSQTLAYIRYSLHIDDNDPGIVNDIILYFKPIGTAIKEAYSLGMLNQTPFDPCSNTSLGHRKIFYDSLMFFMEGSEGEQRERLQGIIPTLEEYWKNRLGSGAVPTCLALIQYQFESMKLPVVFYDNAVVKDILEHTNMIVIAVNDLCSIKKEIVSIYSSYRSKVGWMFLKRYLQKNDAIDSLVPILFFQSGSIDIAVAKVIAFIEEQIETLDRAADQLFKEYDDDDERSKDDVRNFVEGCKALARGNMTWAFLTKRYDVQYAKDGSGELEMVL
jgi:hypothetical protein